MSSHVKQVVVCLSHELISPGSHFACVAGVAGVAGVAARFYSWSESSLLYGQFIYCRVLIAIDLNFVLARPFIPPQWQLSVLLSLCLATSC